MPNVAELVGGSLSSGLAWTDAGFTASDFNSLAAGNCVVATTALNNATALDLWIEVSFSLTVGGTTTALSYLDLCMLPLNQDGTTFGDGTVTGATQPAAAYRVGQVGVRSGITSGNVVTGTFRSLDGPGNRIWLPPGQFRLVVCNQLTVALSASAAAVVRFRSFNLNLNA